MTIVVREVIKGVVREHVERVLDRKMRQALDEIGVVPTSRPPRKTTKTPPAASIWTPSYDGEEPPF